VPAAILEAVTTHGPQTFQQLADRLMVHISAIMGPIQGLAAKGLVSVHGTTVSLN
jgi:predicted ArsR family transcriptional regulator